MNPAMILLKHSRLNLLFSLSVILIILWCCSERAISQSLPLTVVNVSLFLLVNDLSICQIKSIIFILIVIDECFWASMPFRADKFDTKICVVLNNKMMKPCQLIKPVILQSHSLSVVDIFISSQKMNRRSIENTTVKTGQLY